MILRNTTIPAASVGRVMAGDGGQRGVGGPSSSPATWRLCSAPIAGVGARCQPGHFSSPGRQFLCCFSLAVLTFHF